MHHEQKFTESNAIRFPVFPYGCQYHRAPTPLPEEWAGDLAEISRQGYTHVQFRPQWRWHERLRGKPVWDDLDRLFDLAQLNGLKVILKPQLENAPDWVFTELGGTRQGFHGQSLDPIAHAAFYVGGWWPCFDNPLVAEAATAFTRTIAERYKNHPALWFYNAWNEPRSRPLGQCTCPHSVQSYRNYLRRRFGTIEALNNAYGKAWTSFDTVMPPQSHSDYMEMFLWRTWAAESVAHQVELSVKGIREGDPQAKIMCHVGCSSLVQDPACDTSDDLLNSQHVDWYGCSFPIELFPLHLKHRNAPLYQASWLRRVDRNWWCQEFYTNYSNWAPTPDPRFLEQAIWMAIASGATGLTFWQYRSERLGEESNGWGMREIDGTDTERSRVCDHVAKVLPTLGEDFPASETARSRAAIWFDKPNDLLMRIQAMQTRPNNVQEIQETQQYSYKIALEGAHLILRTLGTTADFVVAGDPLEDYRLLVVSAMELVTPQQAQWLEDYVKNGGILMVEYPFACRDERTWVTPARPACGLEKLLGAKEDQRTTTDQTRPENILFDNGVTERTAGWKVTFKDVQADVQVLGRWKDGAVAAWKRPVGKGWVFVSAGNGAIRVGDDGEPGHTPEMYRRACETAGIHVADPLLWTVARQSQNHTFTFIFNAGDQAKASARTQECVYHSEGCSLLDDVLTIPPFGTVILKNDRLPSNLDTSPCERH